MKQNSRSRKILRTTLEESGEENKKRARRLRSDKYCPNYLRGIKKFERLPGNTEHSLESTNRKVSNVLCELSCSFVSCLSWLLLCTLRIAHFLVCASMQPAASGLHSLFMLFPRTGMPLLSPLVILADSVQELSPSGSVPRSSGSPSVLPQHPAHSPPTALMVVKISDWVPTSPLVHHQLLQSSITCYTSL